MSTQTELAKVATTPRPGTLVAIYYRWWERKVIKVSQTVVIDENPQREADNAPSAADWFEYADATASNIQVSSAHVTYQPRGKAYYLDGVLTAIDGATPVVCRGAEGTPMHVTLRCSGATFVYYDGHPEYAVVSTSKS